MKKYVKPELFYERYELSEHIADCLWEWQDYTAKEVCVAHPDEKLEMGGPGGIPDMVADGIQVTAQQPVIPAGDGIEIAVRTF